MLDKKELSQIYLNNSFDVCFNDFVESYRKCNMEPCSTVVDYNTLSVNNPSHFKKILIREILIVTITVTVLLILHFCF